MNKAINRFAIILILLVAVFFYLNAQKPPHNSIDVLHNPSNEVLTKQGVFTWQTWEKEPSTFIWRFPELETAYVLQGELLITPDGSTESTLIKKGDLVTFAPGLRCKWEVRQPFKKHVTHADTPFISIYWTIVFKVQALMRHMQAYI